jgi:NADH-quinone oxidoreductase subunit G
MLVRLARLSGFRPPVFFVDPVARKNSRKAVSLLDATVAISLRALKDADGIVATGVDPVAEAPMLALWMRQAVRKDARVAVLDPRPVTLPFDFTHVALRRGDLCGGLKGLSGAVAADAGAADERLGGVARMLAFAKRPVVVCGTGITSEADIEAAAALARTLRDAGKDAGLFFVLPGPNAFGAVLAENACGASGDFPDILEAIESGEVRALVAVECDPFFRFHDRKRLQAALAKLDLFIALDCVPSDTVNRADFFFPTATLFERGGHFVNQEGRVQSAEPVHSGGAPVRQVSGGGHPPRTFRCDIPGGDPAAAWRLLEELGQALTGEGELSETAAKEGPWPGLWAFAAEEIEALRPWKDLPVPESGLRVLPESVAGAAAAPVAADAETGVPGEALDLLLVDDTFGTEELSTYSEYLARVEKEPVLRLHEEDARLAGLKAGEFACLRLPLGEVAVRVETSATMARRTLVLPRYAGLDWRLIDHLPATLPPGDVFRAKAS